MISTAAVAPSAAIQQTIEQYFAASRFGDDKVGQMVACFAEDCISWDPADAPPLQGRTQLRQFFQTVAEQFQSIGIQEEFVSIHGAEAAVKWTAQGINLQGQPIHFSGIDLFRFNSEGKIQSLKAYWNPGDILKLRSNGHHESPFPINAC